MQNHPGLRDRQRGMTLFELLIVCAIICLLASIAAPIYLNALAKAERTALAEDFTQVYSAFMRYHVDFGQFPPDVGLGSFSTTTMEPLSNSGYFENVSSLEGKLQNGRLMFYWAPDWDGPNADFICIGQSKKDPTVWVYAMHYDLAGSFAYDGVYLNINGQLVRADGKS